MANFNKVLLLGNLTRDPQLSYLPSQTAVVDFGLAVNRKWKSQDGNMKDEVCFVDCRAFGKPAENLNKFCKKGNPLFIEGRLIFDSWTAKTDPSTVSTVLQSKIFNCSVCRIKVRLTAAGIHHLKRLFPLQRAVQR